MRSDHLKRHWITKHKNFDFKVTTIVRGFLKNEDSKPSSNQDLESEILANDKLLGEKIELGEKISKELKNTKSRKNHYLKSTKKLLTCIKAENLQLIQMMISNFIPGSNKRWI